MRFARARCYKRFMNATQDTRRTAIANFTLDATTVERYTTASGADVTFPNGLDFAGTDDESGDRVIRLTETADSGWLFFTPDGLDLHTDKGSMLLVDSISAARDWLANVGEEACPVFDVW